MSRTIAILAATAALAVPAGTAAAKPVDDACAQASPTAAACIGVDKLAEAGATECRRALPDTQCVLPAGHDVVAAERSAYLSSWVHRAVQFQYALGGPVPLRDAQWLGTHNSFNSFNDGETLSHTDSNQQLTLSQQLDVDVRSLELDVHYLPSVHDGGAASVVVCHGRGPDQQHFGCTTEPLLADVLPEISGWLNAAGHRDQVLLLYLEDELGDPAGYVETVAQLEAKLRRPDGSSLIYHPDPAQRTASGCTNLPLGISRDDVRAAGAQVVLVGNCRSGWASDVFGWDAVHVESGSTPAYEPFPACDATYGRDVYATKLVRYYEDSTFVSAATNPTETPGDARADSLTPDKVASMVRCGVNLFGFDQLLPADGRLEASIWSWARGEPSAAGSGCAAQRADGRWATRPCGEARRVACRTASGTWAPSAAAVPFAGADAACAADGASFALPRTGEENSLLRQAAGTDELWLDYRLPAAARRQHRHR